MCERYLRAWADDPRQWQAHIESLPTGLDVPEALATLTRADAPPLRHELGGDLYWAFARARLQGRYPGKYRPRPRKAPVPAEVPAAAAPLATVG